MTDIEKLAKEFLEIAYPIKMMKLRHPALVRHNLPASGKFKKVILINENNIYRMSDKAERYNAMYALSKIISRVFRIPQSKTIPIIKSHLHITDDE